MKIYISGQITGTTDFMERFERAEQKLARMGFDVCNPAKELAHFPDGTPWRTFMAECLRMLLLCDGIYMLKGWQFSKGAMIEHDVALKCGLTFMFSSGEEAIADVEKA